jgi:glycosyltransferase involved in cell wall biosynthesis
MGNERPTYSIIVATYNRAHVLLRSLQSLLTQVGVSLEIVVVDDGSTDATSSLVASINDSRIRYFCFGHNQGASAARNFGIQEARGEFIMIWDSDDILHPHALSRILHEFGKAPVLSVVSAPTRVLIDGMVVPFTRVSDREVSLPDILCKRIPSNEKVRVVRSEVMRQVSYKSRNIDFLVNVSLIEKGRWYHIDEHLGDVFNDPVRGSLTAARKKKSRTASMERAPHLADFLLRHGALLKANCPRRYADYAYGAAIGFVLSGDARRARSFAIAGCFRFSPAPIGILILSYMPFGSRILSLFYR